MDTPFTLSSDELNLLRWGQGKSFRWLVQFDGFRGTPDTDYVLFPEESDGFTVTALYAAEPTRHLGGDGLGGGLTVRVLFSPTAPADVVLELLDRIRERVVECGDWAVPDEPAPPHHCPVGFTAWYRRVADETVGLD